MPGARLEVDMHVIHGSINRLQNSVRVIRGLQLEVEDIVFTGLASSLALLTKEQKELGALVIDLGAGATEYGLFSGGIIRHMGVLAVGGDHVSNDLALGLTIPMGQAEKFKVEHGHAFLDDSVKDRTVSFSSISAQKTPDRTVSLEHLRRIMSVRLEEIFQVIAHDLNKLDLLGCVGAGIVLCGGGANIPGIHQLAGQVLGLPVSHTRPTAISGLTQALDQPEFASALGLVRYGGQQQRKKKRAGLFNMSLRDTVESITTTRFFRS